MPSRQHKRWTPCISEGAIGDAVGNYRVTNKEVPKPEDNFTLGRSSIARPWQIRHTARSEKADDERGAVSRYSNPPGFCGLYGNKAGANLWSKDMGMREVKRQCDLAPSAVSGAPFRSRGGK